MCAQSIFRRRQAVSNSMSSSPVRGSLGVAAFPGSTHVMDGTGQMVGCTQSLCLTAASTALAQVRPSVAIAFSSRGLDVAEFDSLSLHTAGSLLCAATAFATATPLSFLPLLYLIFRALSRLLLCTGSDGAPVAGCSLRNLLVECSHRLSTKALRAVYPASDALLGTFLSSVPTDSAPKPSVLYICLSCSLRNLHVECSHRLSSKALRAVYPPQLLLHAPRLSLPPPPQDGLTYLVNAPTPVTAQIACVNAKGGQMSQFYTYSYMQYFLNPRVSVPLMLKPEMGGWVGGWVVFFPCRLRPPGCFLSLRPALAHVLPVVVVA